MIASKLALTSLCLVLVGSVANAKSVSFTGKDSRTDSPCSISYDLNEQNQSITNLMYWGTMHDESGSIGDQQITSTQEQSPIQPKTSLFGGETTLIDSKSSGNLGAWTKSELKLSGSASAPAGFTSVEQAGRIGWTTQSIQCK